MFDGDVDSQINHLLTTSPSPFPLPPVQSAQKPDLRAAASFAKINNSREQSRRKWSRLDVGSERRTFGEIMNQGVRGQVRSQNSQTNQYNIFTYL